MWIIQYEGSKSAVRAAVANFTLGQVHPPPIVENGVQTFPEPVDPDPADVHCIDVCLTALLNLIDKLPEGFNGCAVYASGDAGAVTMFRVEGRSLTL